MARIDTPNGFLEYESTGRGPAVVMSPGLAGLSSFWSRQAEALSRTHRVIAYDHLGCGKSQLDPAPVSIETMSRDLLALMDALGLERASIVGHSTGGAICQYLAAHAPERLDRIVISCSWTAADSYMRTLFHIRRRVLDTCGAEDYGLAGALFLYPPRHLHENPALSQPKTPANPALFAQTMKSRIDAIMRFDSRPLLSQIKAPTLVIGAEDDTLTPAYFSRELASSIAGAELELLSYGGHSCPVVSPGPYNEALLAFLGNSAPAQS